jgi:hypothetical protein
VSLTEYAQRVNAAVELLEAGVPVGEAGGYWPPDSAARCARAAGMPSVLLEAGRAIVPQQTTVFTVKLPAGAGGPETRSGEGFGKHDSPPWSLGR